MNYDGQYDYDEEDEDGSESFIDPDDDLSDFMDGEDYFSEDDFVDGEGEVILDDLRTYHNQNFEAELNASTADFNKEIK